MGFYGIYRFRQNFTPKIPIELKKLFFFAETKSFDLKAYPIKMQKNLTIILADVIAQAVITIVRGVFPVRLRTVFYFQPTPVRVRR